jgi:hypothetical protein
VNEATVLRLHGPWRRFQAGSKIDANGQSLAYVYSRENASDAHMANALTTARMVRLCPRYHMGVDAFQSDDGGGVNLGQS